MKLRGIKHRLTRLPFTHVQAEGISAQGSPYSARINPVREQFSGVLVARLSGFKADFGVSSEK
jgi:hypothetical protein